MESSAYRMLPDVMAAHPDVETRKGFLGFGTKRIYRPTGSVMKKVDAEYGVEEGARLQALLEGTDADRRAAATRGMKISSAPNGNVRLDYYRTADRQFVMAQLFKFSHFSYEPAADVMVFKGADADALLSVIE